MPVPLHKVEKAALITCLGRFPLSPSETGGDPAASRRPVKVTAERIVPAKTQAGERGANETGRWKQA